MFERVNDFGEANASAFPAKSLGAEKFAALKEITDQLKTHGMEEASGRDAAMVSTGSKREAREALRTQMEAISQTAKRMAASTPGMENSFRMPRTSSDQALLNGARAFATDAEPLKKQFIQWELPADFPDKLKAAIENFEHAVNARNLSRNRSVAATAAIDEVNSRGKQLVRDLDAIVSNKFRDDKSTLAAWKGAVHLERPSHRKKESAKNPAQSPDSTTHA
jgi:hypothetical protein